MTARGWVRSGRRTAVSLVAVALALAVPGPAASAAAAAPALSVSDVAVITIGATATVSVHGKVHDVGKLGGVMYAIDATPSGELVIGDNMLKLITPSGAVKVLSGTATVDGFAVSPDGRYVAWSVSPSSYRAKQIYKLYLYDLQRRRVVHSRLLAKQASPVGFLDDGRVAISGDSYDQSFLWTPATGRLAKLGARPLPGVTHAAGHLLVHERRGGGCSAALKDSHTGKQVRIPNAGPPCQFLEGLSPDGTRWWSGVLSGLNDQLVVVPAVAAAATGKLDLRLGRLFGHERMTVTDGVWLDSEHLLLVAQRYKPGAKVGRQLEQLCSVPVVAAPTCSTLKDLGPYERPAEDTDDPVIGPDVWLAHPLGQ